MNKIVVNVIVIIYIVDVKLNVNIFKMFTDYMHKKCCETNYSLCRDI